MTISTVHAPLNKHETRDNNAQDRVEISLISDGEPQRRGIERFIRGIFRCAYGARIHHLLPHLLSMRQNGRTVAAVGIRPAEDTSLFLETYLDKPVENMIAEKLCRPIDRCRIVEVGNLASAHGGGARTLIVTLTAYLNGAGYEWAVFTASPKVRNNFAKLGIELTSIAVADKTRLGNAQYDWGNYYDQEPVVVVANVAQAVTALLNAMEEQRIFPTAQQLWNDACHAGRQGCLWQPPRTLDAIWPEWSAKDDIDFLI